MKYYSTKFPRKFCFNAWNKINSPRCAVCKLCQIYLAYFIYTRMVYVRALGVAFACSCRVYTPPIKYAALRYTARYAARLNVHVASSGSLLFSCVKKHVGLIQKAIPAKYQNDVSEKIQSEKQVVIHTLAGSNTHIHTLRSHRVMT